MPRAVSRPCRYPGCPRLVSAGFCRQHQPLQFYQRPGSAARGYGAKWQRASASFLREHPLCAHCSSLGKDEPSTVTDHVIPHRGDTQLFWDRSNWQALCKGCHDRKTVTEDGGFGRPCRS